MAAQNHVWIGWQIDSDTPTEVDVSVDDFVVSDGAPFFVNRSLSGQDVRHGDGPAYERRNGLGSASVR